MPTKEIQTEKFWAMPAPEVLKHMGVSADGLTDAEVQTRLKSFGQNILPRGRQITPLETFLSQFKNPLIIVLLLASAVTAFLKDYLDSIFILVAVAVNTALGFYQENKAENALAKLSTYIKEVVRVVRNGAEEEIGAEDLVPGDVIRLFPGGRVPADARIIEAHDLAVDESILTGESLPSRKGVDAVKEEAEIMDRDSMVFAGTLVAEGLGFAAVTGTGKSTELGRIAELIGEARPAPTPFQARILKFTSDSTIILGILTALLFAYGIYAGVGWVEMFIISVAVAVAAVPEGLPIALTVVLSVGVLRLAKKKGVIRKLLAAETLGSTTVIMTDKTGTLTEARMVLSEIMSDYDDKELLELALINTDVIIEKGTGGKEARIIGTPLESAVVKAAIGMGISPDSARAKFKVFDRHPFNSTNKFSGLQIEKDGKKVWVYMGAPDILLNSSDTPAKEKESMHQEINRLAYAGNRVLAVAEGKKILGLLAFRDPIRPSVAKAIQDTRAAGIRTVIVTGDHKGTAFAIGKEIGLCESESEVLTGEEIRKMSDAELIEKLGVAKVFARVIPEDKLRIARMFRQMGEVVAMTGDGVNDAPALKEADIGIAIGTGTDVAKAAADLVLLDNNFETITYAVEEGRRIMQNIKKVITFLFSSLFVELILIAGAIIFSVDLPVSPLQILWINFFLDSFPAISLAFENGINHLKEKPFGINDKLFTPIMKFMVVAVGGVSSVVLFAMYLWLIKEGHEPALVKTFIFATLSIYTLILIFSIKNFKANIWSYNPFSNIYLVGAVALGFGFTALAVYAPFFQNIFGTVALPGVWVAYVIIFGLLNLVVAEAGKVVFRRSN